MKLLGRLRRQSVRLRAAQLRGAEPGSWAQSMFNTWPDSAPAQHDAASLAALDMAAPTGVLRVASYNIHKGVIGMGPAKRLSIHELQGGLRDLRADLIFLQEVQFTHPRHARRFAHWPELPQHELLGQGLGMHTAYHTNAITRHGEHGNALLTRLPILSVAHHDVSDHRFEQRGLLHVRLQCPGTSAGPSPVARRCCTPSLCTSACWVPGASARLRNWCSTSPRRFRPTRR
jgi:Metal-dependent hydrolase